MGDVRFHYLSGVPHAQAIRWRHGGLMFTPEMGNKLDLTGIVWAADNGCYTAGERFNVARWLRFLDRYAPYAGTCVFAVAPDVPFDAAATWERSRPLLDAIRQRGYVPALAIQNGIDRVGVPWDEIGAVFIAGDRPFKTSQTARRIVREAKQRGMWAHIARGNSLHAVQAAYDMGADSLDGTYLRFGPDINWKRLQGWLAKLCPHAEREVWGADPRYSTCSKCKRQLWGTIRDIL